MNINKWNEVALQATDKQFSGMGAAAASGVASGLAGSLTGGSSGSSGSSTTTPAQIEQMMKLLGGADAFVDGGGFMGQGNEYLGQSEDALKAMAGHYGSVLTGDADTAALEGALGAQASQAQGALDTSIAGIGEQAQLGGGSGGSRQGIAEGVATGEANTALQQTQANTINQFSQAEQARKMQAAQGLGGTAGAYQQLQEGLTSDADNMMKTLLAYQSLISGDMGGTTDTVESGSSKGGGLMF